VIGAHADVNHIVDDIKRAFENGLARGGEIAAATTARLGPSVTAINQADLIRKTATDAELAAWAPVLAADHSADITIGATRDAMWSAIDRARQSPHMDHVFPGGIETYTGGDPRGQPVLMQVLNTRIASASAPQWTDALKQGWIATIDGARAALATAVDAPRPADAALTVADAGFRAAARTGHTRLTAFKRDLKNLGLNEAQIHEIIPDTPRTKAKPGNGSATPPVTSPANPPATPAPTL
jgi:hypothetical protein